MSFKIASHPFIFAAVAGMTATGIGAYVWHEQSRPPILEVYLFSLKGGQAAFIRTPEDKRILIDGGANSDVIRQITNILPFYSRHIDAVIVTKDDLNHVGGLVEVVSRYSIGTAYIPAMTLNSLSLASSTDPAYRAFLDALDDQKVKTQSLKSGNSVPLDSKTTMDVLFPTVPDDFSYSKASGPEVLMKIRFGSTSVSFLGDATTKIQRFVASSSADSYAGNDSNALVIPQSITLGNIAAQLIETVKPGFLIYSQNPPKGNTKDPKSKKKPSDPLSEMRPESKFNLKEKGTLRMVSNGISLSVY